MSERKKLKTLIRAGAALGALASVGIALMMDVMFADSMGGTWRAAISDDFQALFAMDYPPGSFPVTLVFIAIMLVLGLFGALMGTAFVAFIYKFIQMLVKE